MTTLALPAPALAKGRFAFNGAGEAVAGDAAAGSAGAFLDVYTDEALFQQTGVRIAFTTRAGGVSSGPYDSLNFGSHVNDDLACVQENRRRIMAAFDCEGAPLLIPNQVHGDRVLTVPSAAEASAVQAEANEGADALVVAAPQVAALLCYADCVPVIIVSPTGRFAVAHAGWRGVDNCISVKSVHQLAQEDAIQDVSGYSIYIGPHIRRECFETGADVHAKFTSKFGLECAADDSHIDLALALRIQLERTGISSERICDLGACTVCRNEEFFSYRAQGGTAGRHAAFAIRL